APPREEDAQPVTSVNGVSIPSSLYERRLALALAYRVAAQGAGARGEMRQQVLQQLIEEELVRQLAQTRGVSLPDQVIDAQVEALRAHYPDGLETWLADSGLELADLRAQIEGQLLRDALCTQVTQDLSRKAEQVQVTHILVSQASLAEEIVSRLKGGESFAALAEQYSEDPTTGAQGGDPGFLPRGIMPPAFDEAAFALPVGGTSDVVRSSTGYHVIRVLAHEDQRPVDDALWPAYRQQACHTWLEEQLDQAQISVFLEDVEGP
ncbi:MAG TPA: peptidylprolyl isomerase, partial [Gammaproteobacteria bacterium]|nr:peptidylprolyl isomerase [Gammaproteobacteria bacterium]